MTRNMRSVTPVHIKRCWKGVLVSGTAISGINGVKGFTRSRKRTAERNCVSESVAHDHLYLVCLVVCPST